MQDAQFTYGSVCSGIEAATVGWHYLGLRPAWFSEIDKDPSSVLRWRIPDVPNYGNMLGLPNLVRLGIISAPDWLVGGTPCQAFSVAGLRKGMKDPRGKLTLAFVDLADAIDEVRSADGKEPVIITWENVPGVLSHKQNPFGCFIAALVGEDVEIKPPGGKWAHAGCVYGPKRAAAWRVLDSQYFGVAQRRNRVFVVASAREGFDPAEIFLEFEGMRRDSPPSREAGQNAPAHAGSGPSTGGEGRDDRGGRDVRVQREGRSGSGSHWDGEEVHPTLTQSHNTGGIGASNQEIFSQRGSGLVGHPVGARMLAFGRYEIDETASTMKARDYKDATDLVIQPVQYSPEIAPSVTTGAPFARTGNERTERDALVVHGTQDPLIQSDCAFPLGRNNGAENAIAIPLDLRNANRDPNKRDKQNRQGVGIGAEGDPAHTLTSACVHGIAHAPIAWDEELNPSVNLSGTLLRGGQGGRHDGVYADMVVRRLTPREAERLQGFPDDWTLVPQKKANRKYLTQPREGYQYVEIDGECWQLMADGARYKACGNSMTTYAMRWIGYRILRYLKMKPLIERYFV